MNYKPLFDEFTSVEIQWKKPCLLDDLKYDEKTRISNAYIYKLLGRYGQGEFKLFYIGISPQQYVSKRLINQDHQLKQKKFQDDHPKHKLYYSVGLIEDEKAINFISDVERLLIYSHYSNIYPYFKNVKNKYNHNVSGNYKIINKGFTQDGMYKEIAYGLFHK